MTRASKNIRGRATATNASPTVRNPNFNQPPLRTISSRPRTFVYHSLPLAVSTSSHADTKKNRLFFFRIPSSALLVSTIALAFFVFGIVVSSNISAILVSPNAKDIPLSMPNDHTKSSSSLSAFYPMSNITSLAHTNSHSIVEQPKHTDQSHIANRLPPIDTTQQDPNPEHNKTPVEASSDSSTYKRVQNDDAPLAAAPPSQVSPHPHTETSLLNQQSSNSTSELNEKPLPDDPMEGRVSWYRSWPLSPEKDDTNLIPLAKALNFTNRTMLNYFHMHKTGGVTLKSEVMGVVNNPDNKANAARRGYGLKYLETCYEVPKSSEDNVPEGTWRCDFRNVRKMTDAELADIDIVMGHQYWKEGTEVFFSNFRKVRYFSIFRHPLPRKLSFFYHFFIRNLGRDENKVDKEEVIKFLLGQDMPEDASTRDAGPNYYASRMTSDGIQGFIDRRFRLDTQQSDEAISEVISKLEKTYAFVGLQVQHEASQCMLEKLIQVFAHARGIDDLVGTPKLSFNTAKLNSGEYPWTSEKIWKAMTVDQRNEYKRVERVDLAIYEKAVQKFKEDVKLYSCKDRVIEEGFLEDIFE